MKPLVLVGVLLAALGAFVLIRGLSYTSDRSVVRIAGLEASVQERRAIPTWAGVAALAGGALLIGAGMRSKKA